MTTPSLGALRLYSESFNLGTRREWQGALELARQAVAADETFASAQVWLAWAMRNNGMPREAYVPVADKAVKLSTAVMEWERQWILGSYFMMAGDDERAEAAYQALAQLRPDHFWGINNLAQLYRRQNRAAKALPYVVRLADLRPHDPDANHTATRVILDVTRNFVRARPYAKRLQESAAGGVHLTRGPVQAWALFFDAAEHLASRDVVRVEAAVIRNLAAIDKQPALARDAVVEKAIRYFLALGRGRQARAVVERFEDHGFYYPMYRAMVALSLGDAAAARDSIIKVPYNTYANVTASMLVRLGMIREAETFLNSGPPAAAVVGDFMLRGTVAAARGEFNASIPVLERMAAYRWPGNHARTQADLASVWLRRGDHARAIGALRESWERDPSMDADVDGPYGHDWMPNALLLAELYRRAGRRPEADPIEADLRRLLSTADPDFPLFLKLKRLEMGWSPGATHF